MTRGDPPPAGPAEPSGRLRRPDATNDDSEPDTIEEILDCVDKAGDGEERVSVADIVERIGDGAFAPLLLVPALVMVSPATAVLGVSTFCGALVVLVAAQMAIGRDRLWLPGFILTRTVSAAALDRATAWLAAPARFVDRLWAALCLALALIAPVFEIIPMSATIIGVAIALFGLAMLARDGLFALLGLAAVGGALWLVWRVAA